MNPFWKSRPGKIIRWIVKVLLSAVALYIVFKKVDLITLKKALYQMQLFWLLPAFILFNLSKIISAYRLRGLLGNIDIDISSMTNLKLYYQGMFYNLFLPGGIGGDVYKMYYLRKQNNHSTKKIIGSLLYDRISGLIALVFLAGFLLCFLDTSWSNLIIIATILAIPLGYFGTRLVFPSHHSNYISSQFLSFLVQILQLLCIGCILLALNIEVLVFINYFVLFLFSSIAAILPISLGGAGARELVFLYGKDILNTEVETGILIGLIFFLITALSSFAGAFIKQK